MNRTPVMRKCFLVGFKRMQVEQIKIQGENVEVSVRKLEPGEIDSEICFDTREEVLNLDRVARFEFMDTQESTLNARQDSIIPDKLKKETYDRAFGLFRRHWPRSRPKMPSEIGDWTHVDNLFHTSAQFYYSQLMDREITTVLFSMMPSGGADIILYNLAITLELEVLIGQQMYFADKFWITRTIEDWGVFETTSGEGVSLKPPRLEVPFYMSRGEKFENPAYVVRVLLTESIKLCIKCLALQFLWNIEAIKRCIYRISLHCELYRFSGKPNRLQEEVVDLEEPFIYFPLHLTPEMTTDTLGGYFGDQLLALESLSATVPQGVLIYAKENPLQGRIMRSSSFFARVRRLGNVRYVASNVPSFEMIRNSLCVATITGTAGWEAALLEKGVIVFGLAWYNQLPNIIPWSGPQSVQQAINYQHDKRAFERAFSAISGKLYSGVLDDDYAEANPDYDEANEARKVAAAIVSVLREREPPVRCLNRSDRDGAANYLSEVSE